MKLLALDLEMGNPFEDENGSSTAPEKSWVTEVGLVLYDTELKQPVDLYSAIVNEGKGVSAEAAEYTCITSELVSKYGKDPKLVAETVLLYLKDCDYVVAQNGERADKPWLKEFFKRHLSANWHENFTPPHWLDTMTDVEYPNNCKSKNLTYLGGFHKVFNPFAHRAVTDSLVTIEILMKYDLERVITVSKSPKVMLLARSAADKETDYHKRSPYFKAGTKQYEEMEKWKKIVKKAGFRWDGDAEVTGQKVWYKETRQLFIDEGKEAFNFEVEKLS